jgi:MFS family permease
MSLASAHSTPESPYAWTRLLASLVLMTISGVGMYAVAVALPAVQAEFGVTRSDASLPYAATLIGFGLGGILMGRISDRFGAMVPILIGAVGLGLGFTAAGASSGLWQFALAQLMIGLLGTSSAFAPLVADTSMWFTRRRGIAVAICASGNYLGGAVWPPVLQHYFDVIGWRATFTGVGLFCAATMIPLALMLRRKPPVLDLSGETKSEGQKKIGIPPNTLFALLCVAGVGCCVAMSMPQVHIVAYCGDLGYGAAQGAQMLSVMLGFGIVSRLASGWICDRIGGLRTLLLGSGLQGAALLMFLPFDSLASLYVVSAMFGLFQGGIVPSYAIIVREYFPQREAGARVGTVLMCTLLGMALGGWMTGAIFDLTGSYRTAFLNGIGWNLLNLTIAFYLLRSSLAKNALIPATR